jgi:aryl-alcohol dehydrogenase-like predicted oxidoreductase
VKYRTLGKTQVKVSEVGFGGWAIGGNAHGNSYGPTDDETSLAAIKKSLDLGCNFFDTADNYGHGHSEELLGQALRGNRDNVVIATKVGGDFYHDPPTMNFRPDYIEFALKRSCERLRTRKIDLYQLHNPPLPLLKRPELFQTLEKFRRDGIITNYGVSIHDPREGVEAIRNGDPAAIQVAFNILRQEAKNELFEVAQQRRVGIIAREPLANSFLAGKRTAGEEFPLGDIRHHFPREYIASLVKAKDKLSFLESGNRTLAQAAIRFVLDHDEVSVALPGVKTPRQAEEDMQASNVPSLTGEELLRIKFLREQAFG